MWRIVESLAGFAFASSVAITFVSQRLNYYFCWYIITDRSLRIRSRVVSIQELTMTFSNVQEIRVIVGPIQDLLKLADVEVQSAGGGSKDAAGLGEPAVLQRNTLSIPRAVLAEARALLEHVALSSKN
jgi:uncharacterized membrane protein YdbT with pleckstrin-like domain